MEKSRTKLGVINLFVPPRFIPQRQLDAVPQSQLVVDRSQIILHHMFGGPKSVGDLAVLAALGYTLNDELLALIGPTVISCLSIHNCLR